MRRRTSTRVPRELAPGRLSDSFPGPGSASRFFQGSFPGPGSASRFFQGPFPGPGSASQFFQGSFPGPGSASRFFQGPSPGPGSASRFFQVPLPGPGDFSQKTHLRFPGPGNDAFWPPRAVMGVHSSSDEDSLGSPRPKTPERLPGRLRLPGKSPPCPPF